MNHTPNIQFYSRTLAGPIVKDPEGEPLEHVPSPSVLRAFRSIHDPHIGEKQKAKQARRTRQHT